MPYMALWLNRIITPSPWGWTFILSWDLQSAVDSGLELLGQLKKNKSSEKPSVAGGESPPPGATKGGHFSVLYFMLLLGGAVSNDCCSDFVPGDDFIEMLNPRQVPCNMTHSYVLEVIIPH